MMTSGRAAWITFSSSGNKSRTAEIFDPNSRNIGILEDRLHPLRVGHEVR